MAGPTHDPKQVARLEARLKQLEERLSAWRRDRDQSLARLTSEIAELRNQLRHLAGGATGQPAWREPAARPPERVETAEPLVAEVISIDPTRAQAAKPRRAPSAEQLLAGATAAVGRRKPGSGTSWETEIGTRWLTWAGAFILLIAVGFAVHWAWTTFQTPAWLQVAALHLLALAVLVGGGIAHWRGLPILTRSLSGLGIFALYTVALATLRLYDFWSPNVAFVEFVLITLLAIGFALRLDSIETILLGALGGYLTPIFTSEGGGDHVILFTYLAFLNVALCACAVWKAWSFLKPLALVATALMFLAWIEGDYHPAELWSTEWLAALHAGIFLLATTLPPWLWRQRSNPADLLTLSGTSMWFLGVTWQLFHDLPTQQLALVCWGLAAGHLALFAVTYARVTHADRMPRVQLALAAVFVTLAAPLQLDDFSYLGTAWCIEGLIFTVVGICFRDWQMRGSALLVFLLAAVRFLGWDFGSPPRTIGDTAIDLRFAVIACGALMAMGTGALYGVLRDRLKSTGYVAQLDRAAAGLLLGGGNLLLILALTCQWHGRTVLVLWTLDAALIWAWGFYRSDAAVRWYACGVGIPLVGIRTLSEFDTIGGPFLPLLNLRFGSLALVAAVYFAAGFGYRRLRLGRDSAPGPNLAAASNLESMEWILDGVLGVLANLVLVGALTFEVGDWFSEAQRQGRTPFADMRMARLAAYSILWAVYAAAVVVGGFVLRYPLFRILGLAAFVPILAKVFLVDLGELELLPRVLAFAVLGLMLLGVSVLYQKFAARIAVRET